MTISQKVSHFNLFDQIVREAEENGRINTLYLEKKVKLLKFVFLNFSFLPTT